MDLRYQLSGHFIECCDCFTVCPCWLADDPDEDHCSSLYVWHFDKDSTIEGEPVGGCTVVAALYHGIGTSQAVFYVDDRIASAGTRDALIQAFSGHGGGQLKALARLVGTVVDAGPATITVDPDGWEVTVRVGETLVAHGAGTDLQFPRRQQALAPHEPRKPPTVLTLANTALHSRLGLGTTVAAQDVADLELAVAALPGGPTRFAGRSGMRATFRYTGTHQSGDDDVLARDTEKKRDDEMRDKVLRRKSRSRSKQLPPARRAPSTRAANRKRVRR